jgi:hypothetical protein
MATLGPTALRQSVFKMESKTFDDEFSSLLKSLPAEEY